MKNDIDLSQGEKNEFGDPALHIFAQDLTMGLSCHLELGLLVYYLHDLTIDRSCFGGRVTSVKKMMREFDRFIIWHHRNDLVNNPFFQSVELRSPQ